MCVLNNFGSLLVDMVVVAGIIFDRLPGLYYFADVNTGCACVLSDEIDHFLQIFVQI